MVPPKNIEIVGSTVPFCAGGRSLDLSRPRIMGVINVTPDSFSDDGVLFDENGGTGRLDPFKAVAHAERLLAEGADILDVGGESTRPGAKAVAPEEEMRRVIPVLERLLDLDTMVSVDTRTPAVARAALSLGVHMINDVGGMQDPEMLAVVAEGSAGVCVMHMQGQPGTMQNAPQYADVAAEVGEFFAAAAKRCSAAGVLSDRILFDPGFGFGKTLQHNLTLLRSLSNYRAAGYTLLVGLSRKRLLEAITGKAVYDRLAASVAAAVIAVQNGASIVRVHDVAATVDALQVLQAVQADGDLME